MAKSNEDGSNNTRLDTWKSIAEHLSRSSRTVQRWYAEYGLPVRHLGGDASSVFAYSDELDEWMRNRHQDGSQEHRGEEWGSPQDGADPHLLLPMQSHRPGPRRGTLRPNQLRASDRVVRAQNMWNNLSDVNLCEIVSTYREASDLDPVNAKAFAGLAQALMTGTVLEQLHPSDAYRSAEAALRRALELDQDLIETRCAAAWFKLLAVQDKNGSGADFDEILIQRPGCTQALIGRALLSIAEGYLARALEMLRKAYGIEPLNSLTMALLCWQEYLAGRFESALGFVAEARAEGHAGALLDAVEALSLVLLKGPVNTQRLSLSPGNTPRHYAQIGVLGYVHGMSGNSEKAREIVALMSVIGISGKRDYAYSMALTFLGLNERKTAMEWLDKSYLQGSLWSLGFQLDPILMPLRNDPQTREWFTRLGYPAAEPAALSMTSS